MANLSFDFNKIKRSFFNVTLKDGTVLQVKMPTKNTLEKVEALNRMQQEENANIKDVMDTMAGVIADCMSNNLNDVKIMADQIVKNYNIEEMTAFILEYYEKFIGSIQSNPN